MYVEIERKLRIATGHLSCIKLQSLLNKYYPTYVQGRKLGLFVGNLHRSVSYLILACSLTILLAQSNNVWAVSIGEIFFQSRLGEPLHVQVDLTLGKDEHVENACLSLVFPDPQDEDSSGYLTRATLTLKTEGQRQYVDISSSKPFNDLFARLRLQVKCPGTSNVIKTLTILPELDTSAPQAQIITPAPAISDEAKNVSLAPLPESHIAVPSVNIAAPQDKVAAGNKLTADKQAQSVKSQPPPSARTAPSKPGHPPSAKLVISGESNDKSRNGSLVTEKRAAALERKKMQDADDQMARFLTLQRQVKVLQDKIGEITLQMEQLRGVNAQLPKPVSAVPAVVAAAVAASAPASAVAGQQVAAAKLDGASAVAQIGAIASAVQPASAVRVIKHSVSKVPPPPSILDDILANPLNLAAGAAMLLGLCGIAFIQVRRRILERRLYMNLDGVARDDTHFAATQSPAVSDFAATNPVGIEEPEIVDPITEAELFLNVGRDEQAEEILKDALLKNPADQQIRLKLLTIYLQRKDTKTFSEVASQIRDSGDIPSWEQAAEMGCKLEPGNPMYGDDKSMVAEVAEVEEVVPVVLSRKDQPIATLDFDLGFDFPSKVPVAPPAQTHGKSEDNL